MTMIPGEREVRTGNAGRAGEPEPRERTAIASEGTPATTDPLDAAQATSAQLDYVAWDAALGLLALAVGLVVVALAVAR